MEITNQQAIYEHLKRTEKAQGVRLFDVFVFAPVMVYTGVTQKLPPCLSVFFVLAGIGTAVFNGINYAKIERLKKAIN